MNNLAESYDLSGTSTSSTMFKIYKEVHCTYLTTANCRTNVGKVFISNSRANCKSFVQNKTADDISHDLGEMIFLIYFRINFSKELD